MGRTIGSQVGNLSGERRKVSSQIGYLSFRGDFAVGQILRSHWRPDSRADALPGARRCCPYLVSRTSISSPYSEFLLELPRQAFEVREQSVFVHTAVFQGLLRLLDCSRLQVDCHNRSG